jgi:putative transposase
MSRKRTIYSAEFKSKLVLEVLKNEKTLQEIASANNITPKNLQNWKKILALLKIKWVSNLHLF